MKDAATADPLESERTKLARERQSIEQREREAMAHLDSCKSRLDRIRQEISREEQRLAKAGGGFANQREALQAEKAKLEATLATCKPELRELCEGLLPFTLASSLCSSLKKQLDDEGKILAWNAQHTVLQTRLGKIKKTINAALVAELGRGPATGKVRESLAERLGQVIDQIATPPKALPKAQLIHRHSEDDRRRLVNVIDRILEDTPKQLAGVQKRLERATRRMGEVTRALDKIPHDEIFQPILERLRDLEREKGSAEALIDRANVDHRAVEHQLAEVSRQEKRLNEKIANVQKASSRGALVVKVQAALENYSRVLTASKIEELRDSVVRCFAQLWRKGDVVRRIEIDSGDFRVTLYDQQDRVIPKQQLSAGEKQIYAISMLWALGQVSGRPLPMIVDTPLGRLDSDHRGHLVERYFPHASHQVVILSTDTEIDQAYFAALGPAISHSYHLKYDAAEGRCVIDKGYFWSGQQTEGTHAG